MHTCNWFISSSVNGVLEQVIQDMASALRSHSKDIDLNVITAGEFQHRPLTSRIREIFTKREIWHLFGHAPLWWRIVKLHSRTVHTKLEGDAWGGWPSRFFAECLKPGESVVLPVFNQLGAMNPDSGKAVYFRDKKNIPAGDYEVLDISGKIVRPEALSGIYIADAPTPREAMRAGILTMRGLCIASPKSAYIEEILGPDGYFMFSSDDELPRIIHLGLGERGRHAAISARHYLKSRRSHERCTDSLITLYRKVITQ
ncbi:MAG: hypothetical protein IJS28_10460 [Synergistaceae bacterium]|nr:hypothetical protein [Synergistaceae bacterium]